MSQLNNFANLISDNIAKANYLDLLKNTKLT